MARKCHPPIYSKELGSTGHRSCDSYANNLLLLVGGLSHYFLQSFYILQVNYQQPMEKFGQRNKIFPENQCLEDDLFPFKMGPFFSGWRIHFLCESPPKELTKTSARLVPWFFGWPTNWPLKKNALKKNAAKLKKRSSKINVQLREKMLNFSWISTWCGFVHTEGRKVTSPMGTNSKRNFRRWCKGALYFHYTGCLIGTGILIMFIIPP